MTDFREPLPPGGTHNNLKIAVIGAGATGAITALELHKAGYTVTLIDAGAPGNGSSSRSAACFRQQFGTPSTVRGLVYAGRYYKNWQDEVGGATSPLVESGYLFLKDWSANFRALSDLVTMQQKAGLDNVKLYCVHDIEQHFHYVQTVGLKGATWCPTDGFLIHDLVYKDAIDNLRKRGARIILHNGVKDATSHEDGQITSLILEDNTTIDVDFVVNATNAWASKLSEMLGGIPLPIVARKRYLYHVKVNGTPGDFMNFPMVITPTGAYIRPTPDRGLMMGWIHHTEGQKTTPGFHQQDDIETGFDHHQHRSYGYAVRTEIERWIPDVEKLERLHAATSGFYADTPDHNPIIDFDPQVKNLLHAAGFSGHGLMHAPFSARIVLELVQARRRLNEITLPQRIGTVDISTYHVDRKFTSAEGMVI